MQGCKQGISSSFSVYMVELTHCDQWSSHRWHKISCKYCWQRAKPQRTPNPKLFS